MRIAIVVGTRPEIIKMSPLVRACQARGIDFYIVHTGQHYSYDLDQVFFEQLRLPEPLCNLEVGSGSHGEQTGKILAGLEKVFSDNRPDIVLVEGDTNSVFAGALAAAKLHIMVGHVEAGLRSFDRRMPEEINRILTDHCSDVLFAPTQKACDHLFHEGIDPSKVFVTGNTIVDAVMQNLVLSEQNTDVLTRFGLESKDFLLVTAHREENVDSSERFSHIFEGLQQLEEQYGVPVVYPMHPRAKKNLQKFGINSEGIRVVDPVDYLSFLQLEQHASVVLTDSGGVQEESCILQTPCVTLRDNTERPETIDVLANRLAGTDPASIVASVGVMMQKPNTWVNPFGDGKTAEKILDIVEGLF